MVIEIHNTLHAQDTWEFTKHVHIVIEQFNSIFIKHYLEQHIMITLFEAQMTSWKDTDLGVYPYFQERKGRHREVGWLGQSQFLKTESTSCATSTYNLPLASWELKKKKSKLSPWSVGLCLDWSLLPLPSQILYYSALLKILQLPGCPLVPRSRSQSIFLPHDHCTDCSSD